MNVSSIVIEKFWNNIEKDITTGCWNWKGYLADGAPYIYFQGETTRETYSARQVSIVIAGRELVKTKHALPGVCRNKLCVNPDHLVMGDEDRFWSKVYKFKDGCWVWLAAQDKDMYGQFRICQAGKKFHIKAHAYSWELFTGRPIPEGLLVCHKCDHSYCVNPDHLFLGTSKDNAQDREMKGRGALAKLNITQVREIRELHQSKVTVVQLSQLYNVSKDAIYDIINRKRWKWLD